ncbi:phospholipase effector Tle1 domain-containing protein [Sulfurimonas sp.]|uniref:phospholipase effector Tle1 domain-containing protein n=1 Tax=Sulfurimonas sp. TaxID=2022749 RepID=UPI003D0D4BB3
MGRPPKKAIKRTYGKAYSHNQDMVHMQYFSDENGRQCPHDARTRFAYLVVSKAQAKKVAGTLEDDATVLDAIKDEYSSYLVEAIEKENEQIATTLKLVPNEILVKDKLVYTLSSGGSVVCSTHSFLDDIVKFDAAANALDDAEKKDGESRYAGYFTKSVAQCKTDLLHEYDALSKTELSEDEKRPYALISLPYVYNVTQRDNYGNIKEYTYTAFKDHINISLTPMVRVEYGVFFDGTNNNMYNINFYQSYNKYVTNTVKEIQSANVKIGDERFLSSLKDDSSFAKYIALHPNPQKTKDIMNKLRDELIGDIGKVRYFEQSSTQLRNYGDDNASKDASKTFDFLLEVRENFTKSEGVLEKVFEYEVKKNYRDATGTTKEIKEFIQEEILPESDDAGSYVNGYTNIERLYEHYKGGDRLNPDKSIANPDAHKYDLKYFKLYASGSGTVDPVEEGELDNNSLIGLGLGTGLTGVQAHVVYACNKIAQELRNAGIEYVDELVLDVFGFSRGATEARHFVCSIQKEFELLNNGIYPSYTLNIDPKKTKDIFTPFFDKKDGLYTDIGSRRFYNPLRDIPVYDSRHRRVIGYKKVQPLHIQNVSFRHVNIGDTVTHRGLKQSNDFKELNIKFEPKKVGSVYHLMAMDEYRFQFDAYSIFDDDYGDKEVYRNDGNMTEFIVPGAHADVGGGYETHSGIESIPLDLSLKSIFSNPSATVKAWNKAYGWLPVADNKVSYVFSTKFDEPGFYRLDPSPLSLATTPVMHYMYRENLTWLYELVTLQLMHDATQKMDEERDKVPLDELEKKYTLKTMAKEHPEDHKTLEPIYKTLKTNKAIGKNEHKDLRKRYVHHSIKANLLDIANIPDYLHHIPEGELYARRSIYGASGDKFTMLPTLASRLAGYYKEPVKPDLDGLNPENMGP